MLVATKEVNPNSFDIDQNVWIDEDLANILSAHILDLYGHDIVVPSGLWKIVEIQKSNLPVIQGMQERGQPYLAITLERDGWDNGEKNNNVMIVYNSSGYILLGSGPSILYDNTVMPVFTNLKELSKLNNERTHCIVCDNPLNIISPNLHICISGCENKVSNV